jgi:prephenate dehydrogenase
VTRPLPFRDVAVVGLGLVGGSLARDLAARGCRVLAADRDPDVLAAAIAEGVVAGAFDVDVVDAIGIDTVAGTYAAAAAERARGALSEVSLVIIATPVGASPAVLEWLAAVAPRDAVLTDVGSTKRGIMAAAAAAGVAHRFVGGHPMAGSHRSGWAASCRGLFDGVRTWLCAAGADAAALRSVESLWEVVGATPSLIDAGEHDRHVAWTSHLPQLLSSALGCTLAGAGVTRAGLGAGGRDTSRLAGSDPAMWTDILLANDDEMVPALDALMEELVRFRHHLANRDAAALAQALEAARRWTGATAP